ncbi:double-stranded RNA-binding protein 1-like isoform X2 [Tripterygium wilfordii]|uniref:double-stranded RNA-binding protein 1-like isoform X2 n=1 Tax=Tripterygium wilfordii TaxID=458696 RepID=UPI0018F7F225|nr:double-stranded RNA-binding protein 1-like isoform X2 [Tripterygium wilfordii]
MRNPDVSNCYVFKSRLQEYAHKAGLPTLEYETIKEGPSHEPSLKSTVIVNGVRYDSLPGFFNRKATEQSAAEVALTELAKSGELNQCITQPVHETGLSENLLQEYAQKMNFAIPVYQCQRDGTLGQEALFKCTVEIGGIHYIGASARTKKEAEIKAARTALLAIWSSSAESADRQLGNAQLTVFPGKKRGAEAVGNSEESAKVSKAKKARIKKKLKMQKKRLSGKKVRNTRVEIEGGSDVEKADQERLESNYDKESGILVAYSGPLAEAGIKVPKCEGINDDNNDTTERAIPGELLAPHVTSVPENGQLDAMNPNDNGYSDGAHNMVEPAIDGTALEKYMNKLTRVPEASSVVNMCSLGHIEGSTVTVLSPLEVKVEAAAG